MAMLVEHKGPHRLSITVDGGEEFLVGQTPDGQGLEIVGIKPGGAFVVKPRLSNAIEVSKIRS